MYSGISNTEHHVSYTDGPPAVQELPLCLAKNLGLDTVESFPHTDKSRGISGNRLSDGSWKKLV